MKIYNFYRSQRVNIPNREFTHVIWALDRNKDSQPK